MQKSTELEHWTYQLFVDHAELYLPFLVQAKERAGQEVDALAAIFEELGVPQDGKVLDTACGIGRHSVLLAQMGYQVTGIDISPLYIREAQRYAEEQGVPARFVTGDVCEIGEDIRSGAPFDAFINMFTSHGYYGRDADLDLFGKLRELASTNAMLVVLTTNRDWIIRNFNPDGLATAGPIRILQRRSMNLETSTITNDWEFYEGHDQDLRLRLKLQIAHRLYSLHEMIGLLQQSGWRYVRALGRDRGDEFKLVPLTVEAQAMWVVARA